MSYTIHFTNQGIVVFDSLALANSSNATAVFQATKNTLDNSAPMVSGDLDTEILFDFAFRSEDVATRDFATSTPNMQAQEKHQSR